LRTSTRARIDTVHLADLIELLEGTYAFPVTRETITTKTCEYLQLFEYYCVGDVVRAPVSALGSTITL
jgi:hypothetical protein